MAASTEPDRAIEMMTTEDRIVAAALTLIQQHGLGSVTMSQIAETAGVARQTLYNHHRDVNGIIVSALTQHNTESLDLLQMSLRTAATPKQMVEQLVRHFVMVGSHAHGTAGLQDALSAEARATLADYRYTIKDIIRDVLHQGIATGEFRSDIELSIDTHIVHATLDSLQGIAANNPDEASSISTAGTRTIVAALTPHDAPESQPRP